MKDDIEMATEEEARATLESKEFKELQVLSTQVREQMEMMNLVPLNQGGEQYIRDRYPISVLYTRSYLQVIAKDEFDENLSESEIQDVAAEVCDDFPYEVHEAITNAIERVVERRTQP